MRRGPIPGEERMSPLIRLKALLLISQDYLHLPYPHNPTGTHTDIVKDPDPIDSRHSPILCMGNETTRIFSYLLDDEIEYLDPHILGKAVFPDLWFLGAPTFGIIETVFAVSPFVSSICSFNTAHLQEIYILLDAMLKKDTNAEARKDCS